MAAGNEHQSTDQMRTATSAKSYRVEGMTDIHLSQNTQGRKSYSGGMAAGKCVCVSPSGHKVSLQGRLTNSFMTYRN